VKGQVISRDRDFKEFLKVLRRLGRPSYLPFYEHVASPEFISSRMETDIRALRGRDYWRCYVDFWLSFGFDCIPMEIPLSVKRPPPRQTAGSTQGASHGSEARACVFSPADLNKIGWPPDDRPIDLQPFEMVADMLPPGVKIVGGVCCGPFEFASQALLGLEGLAYALVDEPAMVDDIFARLKTLYVSANRRLAGMDCIGACRQGDDLGFKTATFLPPDMLRQHIFPIYRGMAAAAHAQGKPFVLHSCGDLSAVYDDIIACGVDAKHSFEDSILPVADFKQRYGARITPLGGLDVDVICRSSERDVRAYVRRNREACFADGHWALGTGNSLTGYMPVENYLWALDEGLKAGV
jgi:uroporphyrinogen decarboxylase